MERRKRRSPLDEYIDALEDSPEKLQRCSQFYQQLRQFYRRKWGCPLKVPYVQGVEVDLYKLYDTVLSMGGWQKVSATEKWYDVVHALGIGDDTLVAEHGVKLIYMRYLSKYEQYELTGNDDDHDVELVGSRNRNKGFSSFATSDNPVSIPRMSEKPRAETIDTEYAKIIKAILSGLPNEVDFALNVCTIMSHPGPKMLRLSKCPQLITTLMAHLAIFDNEVDGLPELYLQEWSKAENRNFLGFWHNAGITDPEVKALIIPNVEKSKVANGDDEFFTGLYPEFDPLDPVSWRIMQILAIIRSWSFEAVNKPLLATSWSLMKFLLVCANCKWATFVNHSLDILSNISTDIDLSSEGAAASNYLILKTVSECIFADDKLRIIRGLEILAGLCNMDQNEAIISELLNDRLFSRIFDVLSVKDIMLCIYTLESLYQLSELGRLLCQRLSNFPHSVDVFVDLATTDAASFGQTGLAGIKVVEFQGPPQIAPPMHSRVSGLPAHPPPSTTPGLSSNIPPAMRQSLPAPMTPLANPRMTLQRMPSSQNLPPLPQSPQQRFANPTAQLPTVSAALGHGQVNNNSTPPTTGDSKLEVLTTKFIKDHCVADQAASTVRGELYATYVDHMRNVHSILSGSVQMFCNTLKKCFPGIVIKSVRKPTEPPTMAYIIEGIRFNKEPLQNGDHQPPSTSNIAANHPVMQQMLTSNMQPSPKSSFAHMNGGGHSTPLRKSVSFDDGGAASRSETPESAISEENQHRANSIQPVPNSNEVSQAGNAVRFEICTAAVEARSLMGEHEKHETRIIRVENVSQVKGEEKENATLLNGVDHSNESNSHEKEEETGEENSIEVKPTTSNHTNPENPINSTDKHSNPGTPMNGTTSSDVSMEPSSVVENGPASTSHTTQPPDAITAATVFAETVDADTNPNETPAPLTNGVASKKKKLSPKKASSGKNKKGTAANAGPFSVDFASPRLSNCVSTQPTTSANPQVPGDFMCEWDACGRMFSTSTSVLFHNAQDHVNENTMVCRWPSCDGTMRSRWSLVTHLQDHHCSEHILREAARKRHEIGEPTYMSQLKHLLEQTKEVSHHPGYSKHAAYEAIRRHAFNYIPRDLTDEPEGPVTKSIRLTSCLILRNLARYSAEGRRLLRKYESHLSWMALSRLECSAALAQLLNELQQHAVATSSETS